MEKIKLIRQILALIATAVIFLSPFSIFGTGCLCGPCSSTCMCNCPIMGVLAPWITWGPMEKHGPLTEISIIGLIIDIIVWFLMIVIIHEMITGKEMKKKKTER